VEDNSERATLRSKIHNAEVDVSYTSFYPLLKPYISLYPKPKKDQKSKGPATDRQSTDIIDGPKGDLEMWKAVEEAMETGTLNQLRNSKEGVTMPKPKEQNRKNEKSRKTREDLRQKPKAKEGRAVAPTEENDESDGGFFE
jgi:hypothetical protein